MSEWSSSSVAVNGITIHYTRTGGNRPPLILAHGVTDSGVVWTPIARLLEDRYDILLVDARGHGHSDKPQTGYAASDHAADLAGLIETLQLGQPDLIGHSMGARCVSTLAALYPERVGRIVLEDPPWRVVERDSSVAMRQFGEMIAKYQTMSRAEIAEYGREIHPDWDEGEFEFWAESKTLVSPNVVSGRLAPPIDWRDMVAQITCPTLLVTGDPDAGAIVTPETAQIVMQLNANIELAHIPGAGHNIRREKHQAFMAAVLTFLDS